MRLNVDMWERNTNFEFSQCLFLVMLWPIWGDFRVYHPLQGKIRNDMLCDTKFMTLLYVFSLGEGLDESDKMISKSPLHRCEFNSDSLYSMMNGTSDIIVTRREKPLLSDSQYGLITTLPRYVFLCMTLNNVESSHKTASHPGRYGSSDFNL